MTEPAIDIDSKFPSEFITDDIHPMLTQRYAVYTPAIDAFYKKVCEWIDGRDTGGYVYGVSRTGKSKAISYWLETLLNERYDGKVPLFTAICTSKLRSSEGDFLKVICLGLGIECKTSGMSLLRERIAKYMCACAHARGSNYFVFLLDEAQKLGGFEYNILCDIQNCVEKYGFQVTVVSVGSHEMAYKREALALGEDVHITSRFMVRSAKFEGIKSSAELGYVLNAYDEQTEWPVGSGISFTQFFFPKAFETGFRVADQAADMWSIYIESAPELMKKRLHVPMEFIAKAVERLFRECCEADDYSFNFSIGDIRSAILATGYSDHMKMISRFNG